jgi:HSP20 family molecular chaperone IbpA
MDNLVIMAELPDVKKEDIHWEISGDIFTIRAQDRFSSRKYIKEMLLPFVVDEANIQTGYRDGIFEISFRRKRGRKK